MPNFYDDAFTAITRQILVAWPDVTMIIAVPQLQRYNWSDLIEKGQMTLPVAVVRFGQMTPNPDYTVASKVFDIPVDIWFAFAVPDTGMSDLQTIYDRLIDLDTKLQGGGIQDAVCEVVPTAGSIDGTERNELAALFLAHGYSVSAGQLSIVIRTGYPILPNA